MLVDVQCNHGFHTGQVKLTWRQIVSYSPLNDTLSVGVVTINVVCQTDDIIIELDIEN